MNELAQTFRDLELACHRTSRAMEAAGRAFGTQVEAIQDFAWSHGEEVHKVYLEFLDDWRVRPDWGWLDTGRDAGPARRKRMGVPAMPLTVNQIPEGPPAKTGPKQGSKMRREYSKVCPAPGCPRNGEPFAATAKAVYCSPRCNQAAFAARQKQAEAEGALEDKRAAFETAWRDFGQAGEDPARAAFWYARGQGDAT